MATTKDIIIERVFNLPLNKMWAAFTVPEECKKWWGPKEFTCPYVEMDVRVGGKFHNCMRSKDGKDFWGVGTYKEVIPNKKLVCTDHFADKDGNIVPASTYGMPGEWPDDVTVTETFEEVGVDRTKLKLVHVGIPTEMYEDCIAGWNSSLDKIEENIK